jgi:hypothetical protein
LASCLATRYTFQLTEHNRSAVTVGEAGQFVVEYRPELVFLDVVVSIYGWHDAQPFLLGVLTSCAGAGIQSGPPGNAVEPACELFAPCDPSRLARQHKKSCLKGILRGVSVAQDTATHSQDHRAMPLNERCERRFGFFCAAAGELIEQLFIADRTGYAALE